MLVSHTLMFNENHQAVYIESDAASRADEGEAANSVNDYEYGNLTFPCSDAFSVNFKSERRFFFFFLALAIPVTFSALSSTVKSFTAGKQ